MQPLNFILLVEPQASDLKRERGIDAYRWNSMTPEKRADADIAGYVQMVEEFAEALSIYAVSEAQKAEAAAQVERFRLKEIDWTNTLWAAKSRTASPMVTGPAWFPVDRNRKAMVAEMKKVGIWLEWLPKVKAAALRAVKEAGVEKAAPEKANETVTVNGVEIVTNYEIERIQMLFGGKPDAETIGMLKGAGWNWSPKNKAWQRMITAATMRSAMKIASA
jgi:hypothetical protein